MGGSDGQPWGVKTGTPCLNAKVKVLRTILQRQGEIPTLAHITNQSPLRAYVGGFADMDNLMDVQERHITNRKCRDSGVQGQFDTSSLLREMTVVVGLNKGVPTPPYFQWRGWCRAGLTFFRRDMTLRLVPRFFLMDLDRRRLLPLNLTHPESPVTPEAALRLLYD
ncbi:hypothetical protein J6590_033879 [Homalodisca vitripennis]|nr:hypothetical protein J6590_033879 [Homalodisca vitripennis]